MHNITLMSNNISQSSTECQNVNADEVDTFHSVPSWRGYWIVHLWNQKHPSGLQLFIQSHYTYNLNCVSGCSQNPTSHDCWGQTPISPTTPQGSTQQSQLSLSMWFPPISPGEMVPLKFHYSFHHSRLLHLCLSSQQRPLMQQLKAVGVSFEMWLVALRPTRLIGVGGDSQNALKLNHRVAGITMAVMIVYSPFVPRCLDNHKSSEEGKMWKQQQIPVRIWKWCRHQANILTVCVRE